MPTLEQQLADIRAKEQRVLARMRKKETGNKILIGGATIALAKKNPKKALELIELIEGFDREADKKRIADFLEELKAGLAKGGSAGKSEPSEAQDAPARTDFRDLV